MVQLCQKLTCPLIGKWDEKNQEIQTMQGNKREIPKKKKCKNGLKIPQSLISVQNVPYMFVTDDTCLFLNNIFILFPQ